MRERGSNTARPTEKGVGGLPIRSRPVDFGASIRSRRVEVKAQTQKKPDSSIGESGSAIARRRALLTFDASRFGVLFVSIRSRRVDSVASCRFGRVASRFGVPVVPVVPIWSAACVAIWRAGRADTEDKTQKKARFLNRGIGLSYRKASRALNLPLAPLSNTRASARGVRLGLARRFCIVMPTSDRRHIGRCT